MKPPTYITTSWDDGHPLDLRVAELLARYGLRGTFYVPKSAETETMTAAQVRELSSSFEVGAHTIHHVELTRATEEQAWQEIAGSRSWLEDSTGLPCPLFCPPKGKFSRHHLRLIQQAGYQGARSVELLSFDFPRARGGLLLLPTTVQAHPHRLFAYTKNAIRRAAFGNLWRAIVLGHSADWTRVAQALLSRALARGGVFHLWGHSWELQQTRQWQRLEEVLRFLSEWTSQAPALTNWQVCQAAGQAPAGGVKP
jgi:peptidoglycan/xylan/chitin deacetylase (PgdA/CDA1 family)